MNKAKAQGIIACSLVLVACCLFSACSDFSGTEEQREMGKFTINLGGTSRAVVPGYGVPLSDLRYEVIFSQGGTVVKKFTAQGSSGNIQGSIDFGTYDVTLEIYLTTDTPNTLFAEGEAATNPVTIKEGTNTIPVNAYKSVTVSPDPITVTKGGASQNFSAVVRAYPLSPSITWSVVGGITGTSIDSFGDLTVDVSEGAGPLTVIAEYGSNPVRKGTVEVTLTAQVVALGPNFGTNVNTATQNCTVGGAAATPLTASVSNFSAIQAQHTTAGTGSSLTYQWYKNSANDTNPGTSTVVASGTVISAGDISYTPPTTVSEVGTLYYYVVFTNEIYDNLDGGLKKQTATSDIATVVVNKVDAIEPTLGGLPSTTQYCSKGGTAPTLTVNVTNNTDITAQYATTTGGGSNGLSYQWYSSPDNTTWTQISTQTNASYTPLTTTAGTTYYYVVVRNDIKNNGDGGDKFKTKTSATVTVTVTDISIGLGTFSIGTASVAAFTPIQATSPTYTEREGTLIVTVSGFLSQTDSDNVALTIPAVTGFSAFSGHTATAPTNVQTTTDKTFYVKITYNGTTPFSTGTADIKITGLSGLPTQYTYSGGDVTKTVNIKDGQDSGAEATARWIPINSANIAAFAAYAPTTSTVKYYKLDDNVMLSGSWTPISSFSGTFNGDYHTISGLSVSTNGDIGLFERIGTGGVVKNLGLSGTVTSTSTFAGNYIGGLVGINDGNISNCSVTVDVTGTSAMVGGIAGGNTSTGIIEKCYYKGNVQDTGSSYSVGGIAGSNDGGTIRNCYSDGTITATGINNIGGITGALRNSAKVENCYSLAIISGTGNYAGGIVGDCSGGTTQNCVALNQSITGVNTSCGRVAGYYSSPGPLANNYGRTGMQVTTGTSPTTTTPSGSLTDKDGANVASGTATTQYNNKDWWTTTGNWNTTSPAVKWDFDNIWDWGSNNLPKLRNMP